MTKKNIKYTKLLNDIDIFLTKNLSIKKINEYKKEFILESIKNWSERDPKLAYKWFLNQRKNTKMKTILKNIDNLNKWKKDNNGNIKHISNKFFSIRGLSVRNSKNRV